jgi:hypothetical protein
LNEGVIGMQILSYYLAKVSLKQLLNQLKSPTSWWWWKFVIFPLVRAAAFKKVTGLIRSMNSALHQELLPICVITILTRGDTTLAKGRCILLLCYRRIHITAYMRFFIFHQTTRGQIKGESPIDFA